LRKTGSQLVTTFFLTGNTVPGTGKKIGKIPVPWLLPDFTGSLYKMKVFTKVNLWLVNYEDTKKMYGGGIVVL